MSAELRLKGIKAGWMPIQKIREELKKMQAKWAYHKKMSRSLSQKIPEAQKKKESLEEQFNETMV